MTSEQAKKFHHHLVDHYGNLEIWEVDGEKIRQELDIEFPNFAMWPDFSYIPKNELWLDKEHHPDERQFFIDHLLAQWIVLKSGQDNTTAVNKAYRVERSERAKAGDKAKVFDSKGQPHPNSVHEKLLSTTTTGLKIYLINGRLVRSAFFIDFMDGGHHFVYPWVPQDEIWIDDDLSPSEYPFVILHELFERQLMSEGHSYNYSHPKASKIELECHQQLKDLKTELNALGYHIEP